VRRLSIEILDGTRRLSGSDSEWLRRLLARGLVSLGATGELRVRVVGDREMAAAHERYKGVSGTTDVLTFDLSEEPGAMDTDILVCMDEAERQATVRGHTPVEELLLYCIHGALHCLGHDDQDEAAAERMHRAEDELLELLGVGAIYARPAGNIRRESA
jgi:probable rRNA maturation factor